MAVDSSAVAIDSPIRLRAALERIDRPFGVVLEPHREHGLAFVESGRHSIAGPGSLLAYVPAMAASNLGDPAFGQAHSIRFPYVAGAMANGIASVELVDAMGRAGMLGFFGAAGLGLGEVERAIAELQSRLGGGAGAWGVNLIHSPYEPALEAAVSELYVRRNVQLVSASAYLDLTLPLLRYRFSGIFASPTGEVVAPRRLVAKVSRVEVARKFMSPPPDKLLAELVREGTLTEARARMAATVPVAEDVTVEADSGGHTDNRPALALLPSMFALRDRIGGERGYARAVRVGAAGGISTPWAAAAAFAMGAAYVMTGSVNQACRESGSSDAVRAMLAQAQQADVIMAPAADMFEMGVKLQVLKRGTMFAMRAQKLYELYRTHPDLDSIDADTRASIEKTIFRQPLAEVWTQCERFWEQRDASQLERARTDGKHQMALCFRWYLGQSSRWANRGEPTRKVDYQVWCGPAMGAFNEWVAGSFLEGWERRHVVAVAHNLLHGASMVLRHQTLRSQLGARSTALPALDLAPRESAELEAFLS